MGANFYDNEDIDNVDALELLDKSRRLLFETRQNERAVLESVSFRLGSALVQAATSWGGLTALPNELACIFKHIKQRNQMIPPVRHASAPAVLNHESSERRLRVAAILDEFSYQAFASECELVQLRPDRWAKQLDSFDPDLVFIESAWAGENRAWHTKVALLAPELRELLAACRKRSLPTVFWNKEDPVWYGRFADVAGLVDYVFTTDIDCIPLYRWELEHNRIYLLPFAAQPALHNPIQTHERKHAACFAGAYYSQYEERQRDFISLIRGVSRLMPVDIYERRHSVGGKRNMFPKEFAAMLRGTLPYHDINFAYKGYRWGINVNTIKTSRSMFARRVWELLASNTPVISNESVGMRLLLGDAVIASDDAEKLTATLEQFNGEASYRRLRLVGLRTVMSAHTYRHRLDFIRAALGMPRRAQPAPIVVVGRVETKSEMESLVASFSGQTWSDKLLFLYSSNPEVRMPDGNGQIVLDNNPLATAKRALAVGGDAVGLLHPNDWYGPNYLMDLCLGLDYGGRPAVGKVAQYQFDAAKSDRLILVNDDQQYRPIVAASLSVRAALIRPVALDAGVVVKWLETPEAATLPGGEGLGLDEFNYIRDGGCLGPSAWAAVVV